MRAFCALTVAVGCVRAVKVLLRKAAALEGLQRHAEARACLDAAAQCSDAAEYADTLRQLGVRVDLALAFAGALDTWGDAPDACDRVCRAFADTAAPLAAKYRTAPAPAPAPAAPQPQPPPSGARVIHDLMHRMFHSHD